MNPDGDFDTSIVVLTKYPWMTKATVIKMERVHLADVKLPPKRKPVGRDTGNDIDKSDENPRAPHKENGDETPPPGYQFSPRRKVLVPAGLKMIKPGEVIGKRTGVPNKTTARAKEAIELAAEGVGGVERLIAWINKSNDNETVFWSRIFIRLLPLQLHRRSETTVDVTYRSVEDVTVDMKERGFTQQQCGFIHREPHQRGGPAVSGQQ